MKNFDASFIQTPTLVARLSSPGENRPVGDTEYVFLERRTGLFLFPKKAIVIQTL